MSMQRLSAATALTTIMLASGWAGAAPFPPAPVGPVTIQLFDNEQLSPSNNITGPNNAAPYAAVNTGGTEGNWGIVQINSINQGTVQSPVGSDIQGGGPPLMILNTGGLQILGIFYGIHLDSLSATGSLGSGGRLDLYGFTGSSQNIGTELTSGANLAKRTAQDEYTGFTCASGNTATCTFLAELDFVYGSNGAADTISTIATTVNPVTSDGTAKSYLSVNTAKPGAWSFALDNNFFTLDPNNAPLPNKPDVRLSNGFEHGGAGAWDGPPTTDIIGLLSHDPARTALVPEPASLALLATGLIGLGAAIRRRRK